MKHYFYLLLSIVSHVCYSQYSEYTWNTQGITVAGGNGAGGNANQLNFPYSIFVDTNNTIYITDTQNHRIQKWIDGATEGTTVAGGNGSGSNANQFNTPTCVWVDNQENIYVMDSFNNRIQKWSLGATEGITIAGGNGEGTALNQFNKPGGFYFKNNTFYIVDAGNNRIIKWIIGDTVGTLIGGGSYGSLGNQLANPTVNGTIYVDENENLYVTDYVNNRVQKFTPGNTNAITVAGGNGSGTANNQLKAPNGIFILPNGRMIISEYTGRRINMWVEGEAEGTIIAGGNGNGSGANQFKSPRGNFIGTNGDLYVADMANHRIQKFSKINITPTCSANLGGGIDPSFITFQINGTTFDHNTFSAPTEFYHNYPQTTILNAGHTYDFYTATSSEAVIGIWLDYNQNNTFESNEYSEIVNNMQTQNTTSFTIPNNAPNGLVKMRIRSRAYGNSITGSDSCTTFGSGETRDYIFTINNNLGIQEIKKTSKLKIFPNPSDNFMNIESTLKIEKITIYNLYGQKITTYTTNKMDISNLKIGTYMAEIEAKNGQKEYHKVIKK